MDDVRVNRWLDFADRVGWTAIYALAAAIFTVLTTAGQDWETGLKFVGVSVALAVVKVVLAQRAGDNDLGAAIPGRVLEATPPAELVAEAPEPLEAPENLAGFSRK